MTYLGVQISANTAGLTSAISLNPSMAPTLNSLQAFLNAGKPDDKELLKETCIQLF